MQRLILCLEALDSWHLKLEALQKLMNVQDSLIMRISRRRGLELLEFDVHYSAIHILP